MYCIKCKGKTEDLEQEIKKSKNNRFYSVSKCEKCGFKKVQFIKNPQDGEGIKEIIKNVKAALKGPRNNYPPKVRALMNKLKDEMITGITVGRDPISPGKIINLLTLGAYNKAVKKIGYDDMYHLYSILTLSNGERYRVEKNEVIKMTDYEPNETPNESIEIPMNNPIRWEDFFLNAKDFHEKFVGNFYLYNQTKNNCQKFITSLLKGNDLGIAEDFKFIEQDVGALLKELEGDKNQEEGGEGIFSKIANFGTKAGAIIDILKEGEGMKAKKIKN